MTRISFHSFLLLALAFAVTGCDQNAFEEDYPNPDDGLGPYVAFDAIAIQNNFGGTFDPANAANGVTVNVNQNQARTVNLSVRLPAALGEDVTVTYQVRGDAVRGTDYTIAGTTGDQGQLVLEYDINDTESFRDNIVVSTAPAAVGDAPQSVTITLTGATTASGQQLTIGRLPDGRDRSVTLRLVPPTA